MIVKENVEKSAKIKEEEIIKPWIKSIGRIRSAISVENRDTQHPTVPL